MVKQAPTVGKMLIMVGFALSCFGLLLFLWLAFGGPVPLKPKGYRFQVSFGEATQLAKEADVRISGVPVGKVKTVEPNKQTGRSLAVIEMEQRYAPIARDTKAILRQKTLLGETYVELTPGDPRSAGTVPENGSLPSSQVSPTVELDEIFRAFDPATRRAFQTWMQGQATAVRGRSRDISDAIGNLDPFAEDANDILRVLNSQEGAVRQLVRNTGVVFDAISERRGQLQGLIRNSNTVFTTTAQRDQELRELFTVLPTFNREARTTVNRLTEFSRDTNPLVTQLRPAARELTPTMQALDRLAPDLKGLFRDLPPLFDASERGLPALRQFLQDLRPALGEFDPVLKQLNPILNYLGNYRTELRAFFANVPSATQATTPDGVHYLRTLNPMNAENLAVYPRRLGSNRTNPYVKPEGYLNVGRGGMLSYETRHCGRSNPAVSPVSNLAGQLQGVLPILNQVAPAVPDPLAPAVPTGASLADNIFNFVLGGGNGQTLGNVPCRYQGPFTLTEGKITPSGVTTQYPQVREARSSTSRP